MGPIAIVVFDVEPCAGGCAGLPAVTPGRSLFITSLSPPHNPLAISTPLLPLLFSRSPCGRVPRPLLHPGDRPQGVGPRREKGVPKVSQRGEGKGHCAEVYVV